MGTLDTIDYGRIHVVAKDRCQLTRIGKMADCMEPSHWSKPCLFKPGAEKISSALGVTVHYPSLRDYESAVLAKAEIHMIVLRCELRDAHGNVVAEGIGARDLKQDWGDVNKALKMCAKSAHIDAVLRLAGISSMFTQDIEDRPPAPDNGDASFVDDGAAFPDFNPGKSQAQAQTQARSPGRPPATDGRSTGTPYRDSISSRFIKKNQLTDTVACLADDGVCIVGISNGDFSHWVLAVGATSADDDVEPDALLILDSDAPPITLTPWNAMLSVNGRKGQKHRYVSSAGEAKVVIDSVLTITSLIEEMDLEALAT